MDKYFVVICLLLLPLCTIAQDTTLPGGKAYIFLTNDKIIKDVSLWKIDTVRVEYVKEGNLNEILASQVKKIETANCLLQFDGNYHLKRLKHDYFITNSSDTTYCTIDEVSFYYIYYYTIMGNSKKRVLMSQVEKYSWNQSITNLNGQSEASQNPVIQQDKQSTSQVDPSITKDTSVSANLNTDYFHRSFDLGVTDGEKYPTTGYWIGGFLLGLTLGSYILNSAAISEESPYYIPPHVDEYLYKSAYEKTTAIKKGKSASKGVLAGKLVVLFFMLMVIGSFS